MKFNLPVWNGVKTNYFKQKVKNIQIKTSNIPGIYIRIDKNFVNYQKDYTHMTPLIWKGFIEKIRFNKVNFINENSKNIGECLEIGAGDGFNIRALKWKKKNRVGYTICDPFIKPYKKEKIEFINNFYEKVNFKKKFDTIIMFSVLEHVNNFIEFIKISKNILKKDGNFFLEIPIIDNQFINGDFNCLLHEHLNYFSKKGIFNLFKMFQLNIKSFYFKNDTGFFCIKHAKEKKQFTIEKNIPKLKKIKEIFKNKILNFKIFLKKNSNRRIIFYGANNGLNNLIHLALKTISFYRNKILIVDSDQNKWGKFLGSFSKAINKPEIIKKTDLICVSSLSFYDEIVLDLKKNNQIINLNDI